MSHKKTPTQQLHSIRERLAELQDDFNQIKSKLGENDVEQVNSALSTLSTSVNALIASKGTGTGGITPAEAQQITDAINVINQIVVGATPAA